LKRTRFFLVRTYTGAFGMCFKSFFCIFLLIRVSVSALCWCRYCRFLSFSADVMSKAPLPRDPCMVFGHLFQLGFPCVVSASIRAPVSSFLYFPIFLLVHFVFGTPLLLFFPAAYRFFGLIVLHIRTRALELCASSPSFTGENTSVGDPPLLSCFSMVTLSPSLLRWGQ